MRAGYASIKKAVWDYHLSLSSNEIASVTGFKRRSITKAASLMGIKLLRGNWGGKRIYEKAQAY
jgi:hypothetical protein